MSEQDERMSPCPFCGADTCSTCPFWWQGTVAEWNQRPLESALRASVAELRANVDTMRALLLERGDLKLQARNAELVSVIYAGSMHPGMNWLRGELADAELARERAKGAGS